MECKSWENVANSNTNLPLRNVFKPIESQVKNCDIDKTTNGMRENSILILIISIEFRHKWKCLDEIEIAVMWVRAKITASNLLVGIIIGSINGMISLPSCASECALCFYVRMDLHEQKRDIGNPKHPKFDVAAVSALTQFYLGVLIDFAYAQCFSFYGTLPMISSALLFSLTLVDFPQWL